MLRHQQVLSNPFLYSLYKRKMQLNNSNTNNNTNFKMAESEVTEQSKRKQIRQPPTIPFLWEDRPGIPKKDWKPEKLLVNQTLVVPSNPVNLFASIPFKWEEKPGKPFPSFLEPLMEPSPLLLPAAANLISISSPSVQSHCFNDTDDDNGCESNDDGDDEKDEIFGMDLQSFGFTRDDLFISDPSLLANRLQSSVTISDAAPVKKTPVIDDVGSPLESLSSSTSESGSSISSYATGMTTLVGASFLDSLFPLVTPTSGFLHNAGNIENGVFNPLEKKSKDLECVSNCTAVGRRPPTLGELIMMSRRRSCRRKAVQMRKNNLSMNFTKKAALGCWNFGINTGKIRRLQGSIRQPRLNLM